MLQFRVELMFTRLLLLFIDWVKRKVFYYLPYEELQDAMPTSDIYIKLNLYIYYTLF